jgi:hypothetical protein
MDKTFEKLTEAEILETNCNYETPIPFLDKIWRQSTHHIQWKNWLVLIFLKKKMDRQTNHSVKDYKNHECTNKRQPSLSIVGVISISPGIIVQCELIWRWKCENLLPPCRACITLDCNGWGGPQKLLIKMIECLIMVYASHNSWRRHWLTCICNEWCCMQVQLNRDHCADLNR